MGIPVLMDQKKNKNQQRYISNLFTKHNVFHAFILSVFYFFLHCPHTILGIIIVRNLAASFKMSTSLPSGFTQGLFLSFSSLAEYIEFLRIVSKYT